MVQEHEDLVWQADCKEVWGWDQGTNTDGHMDHQHCQLSGGTHFPHTFQAVMQCKHSFNHNMNYFLLTVYVLILCMDVSTMYVLE